MGLQTAWGRRMRGALMGVPFQNACPSALWAVPASREQKQGYRERHGALVMSSRGSADPANKEIHRQEGRPGFPGDHSPLLPARSSPSQSRKAQDCLGSVTGVRKHSESQSLWGGTYVGHSALQARHCANNNKRQSPCPHTLNALFI